MNTSARRGMLLALAGFALLSMGDTVIKTMAGEWSPLAVGALRFAFGAVGLSALLALNEGGAAFRPTRPLLQIARGLCLAIASLLFFCAIFVMPLAEATAVAFLSPLLTALLSGPLLGEKVRPPVWIASLVAFGGVSLILQPNVAELGWVGLLPLASAFFFSLMMIANRAAAGQGSALSMQVFVAVTAAPVLTLVAIGGHFSGAPLLQVGWPDWSVVARCALVAVTASSAHWLIYLGTTRAGAATIAPMTYVQLLVASVMGWLVFGDRPGLATLGGAIVIIAAGLYLWSSGRNVQSGLRER
ncbi:DMT family transporter [Altererythrobacter sp. H2]|uniref:DMT family transporter n=1 Tax=Altererythrobacter sp. H2 TaxID=3108391 RepID=UPI002B4BB02D|nr:DMT family transporter [Altererythrobacter sp. H2]WRK96799.1 DMT family transporter [Altererythrobacter sp. H2]